jgi:hypothetical protein
LGVFTLLFPKDTRKSASDLKNFHLSNETSFQQLGISFQSTTSQVLRLEPQFQMSKLKPFFGKNQGKVYSFLQKLQKEFPKTVLQSICVSRDKTQSCSLFIGLQNNRLYSDDETFFGYFLAQDGRIELFDDHIILSTKNPNPIRESRIVITPLGTNIFLAFAKGRLEDITP